MPFCLQEDFLLKSPSGELKIRQKDGERKRQGESQLWLWVSGVWAPRHLHAWLQHLKGSDLLRTQSATTDDSSVPTRGLGT